MIDLPATSLRKDGIDVLTHSTADGLSTETKYLLRRPQKKDASMYQYGLALRKWMSQQSSTFSNGSDGFSIDEELRLHQGHRMEEVDHAVLGRKKYATKGVDSTSNGDNNLSTWDTKGTRKSVQNNSQKNTRTRMHLAKRSKGKNNSSSVLATGRCSTAVNKTNHVDRETGRNMKDDRRRSRVTRSKPVSSQMEPAAYRNLRGAKPLWEPRKVHTDKQAPRSLEEKCLTLDGGLEPTRQYGCDTGMFLNTEPLVHELAKSRNESEELDPFSYFQAHDYDKVDAKYDPATMVSRKALARQAVPVDVHRDDSKHKKNKYTERDLHTKIGNNDLYPEVSGKRRREILKNCQLEYKNRIQSDFFSANLCSGIEIVESISDCLYLDYLDDIAVEMMDACDAVSEVLLEIV